MEHFVPELRHENQVRVEYENHSAYPGGDRVIFSYKPSDTIVGCAARFPFQHSTRPRVSVKRWPGRSDARGWCSTTALHCAPPRARGRIAVRLGRASCRSQVIITRAKKAGWAWLGEVSRRSPSWRHSPGPEPYAYRNFLASRSRARARAPRWHRPGTRSRKDNRQAIRFTRNARFAVTDSGSTPAEGRGHQGPMVPSPAVRAVLGHGDQGRRTAGISRRSWSRPGADAVVCLRPRGRYRSGVGAWLFPSDGEVVANPRFQRGRRNGS